MRAVVIINPIAGPRGARSLSASSALARAMLSTYGYLADVRVTEAPTDAYRFARAAVDTAADLVVAWGGDGTVNGAGSALVGTPIPLGIVPAGSGNGLARDLRLPRDPLGALVTAATGATRAIDAGEVDGALFFNVAGLGLDARIASRLAEPGARRGLRGYVTATFAELPVYQPQTYAIDIGESRHAGPSASSRILHTTALFIAIANSRQYGHGAQIAPLALLDDGELELVIVEPQSGARLASRVPAFFRGRLREGRGLLMRTVSACEISSDRPMHVHVDGEPRTGGRALSIRVRPQALRVRVGQPAAVGTAV